MPHLKFRSYVVLEPTCEEIEPGLLLFRDPTTKRLYAVTKRDIMHDEEARRDARSEVVQKRG